MNDILDQIRRPFRVRGVLFDFDDTLTLPGALDFAFIRTEVGCPPHKAILEYIAELPTEEERRRAGERLAELEMEAAGRSRPNPAAADVVAWLRARDLPVGIVTRNGRSAILRALQNFSGLSLADFQVIVSRDDDARPKPEPGGVLLAALRMGVRAEDLMVVGDYVFDIFAGRAAGAFTVLLQAADPLQAGLCRRWTMDGPRAARRPFRGRHPPSRRPRSIRTRTSSSPSSTSCRTVVRLGFRCRPASSPPTFSSGSCPLPAPAPALLLGPHLGRDIAALYLTAGVSTAHGSPLLAVGSDPVTFTTDALGQLGRPGQRELRRHLRGGATLVLRDRPLPRPVHAVRGHGRPERPAAASVPPSTSCSAAATRRSPTR